MQVADMHQLYHTLTHTIVYVWCVCKAAGTDWRRRRYDSYRKQIGVPTQHLRLPCVFTAHARAQATDTEVMLEFHPVGIVA